MSLGRVFLVSASLLLPIAAEPPRPVTVRTAVLAPEVSGLEVTGSVTARHRSRLSSRASGLIWEMHVDAGQRVKKGDMLMELDRELAGIELEYIEGLLEQARFELTDAERLLDEARSLATSGAFPKSEARSRESGASVKAAVVRQLEAREKQQRAVIERHRLVAPYDGVISQRLADEGEWVQTGTPVVELVSLDRPRLDVQVPQEFFARVGSGTDVIVKLDAFPGREFVGEVAATVPVKDPVARTFLTRIEWQGDGVNAGPGMSGNAVFTFQSDESAVQVPRDAVVRFPDGSAKVWVVEEREGRMVAVPRTVKVGDSLAEDVRIIEGLDEGAQVVVRGNEGLVEGQEVKASPEARTDSR